MGSESYLDRLPNKLACSQSLCGLKGSVNSNVDDLVASSRASETQSFNDFHLLAQHEHERVVGGWAKSFCIRYSRSPMEFWWNGR